jgi:hypothetical protein
MADPALNRNQGDGIDHQSRLYTSLTLFVNFVCACEVSVANLPSVIYISKVRIARTLI